MAENKHKKHIHVLNYNTKVSHQMGLSILTCKSHLCVPSDLLRTMFQLKIDCNHILAKLYVDLIRNGSLPIRYATRVYQR